MEESASPNITTKQFSILSDHMPIYNFLLDAFSQNRRGVPAPFWEYALCSSWMDKSYLHRCRIWKDGEKIVGFCFHENPVTDVYFSLLPGYEYLAPEMVAYAGENMSCKNGQIQLVLVGEQTEFIQAAKAAGYRQSGGYDSMVFDMQAKSLDYPLPEGFSFTQPGHVDVAKSCECCWKGFDNEKEEGPWDGEYEYAYALVNAPHATTEHNLAVMNQAGEYVCYAGMWWVPENKLAYLEPLCTVPEYRGRGLAAAALSELYRRLKPLGAAQLTGGGNPFYTKIGYSLKVKWTYWKK